MSTGSPVSLVILVHKALLDAGWVPPNNGWASRELRDRVIDLLERIKRGDRFEADPFAGEQVLAELKALVEPLNFSTEVAP